eukprot:jgi/Ulvmu1/2556/UM014_0006.1
MAEIASLPKEEGESGAGDGSKVDNCASVAPDPAWSFPEHAMLVGSGKVTYSDFLPQVPQPFALQDEVDGARRAIFSEAFLAADSSVGLIVGPQACGKSVVAAKLARDPQTQEMYPDGIMWVHCGAAATAWSVLRQLWQIVRRVQLGTGSQPVLWLSNPAQTEASLSHELVRLLACKRTLLVLDDVRDARAVRACNPLGPHLLCTTFEGSIAKRLQTAVSSVGVRTYEMRVLSLPNMHSLLNAHFSFQDVDAALLESLLAMIGRLPLELVLVSFLFQVVKAYVAFDNKTLLGAVMKRLHASHRTLQEQLHNENGAQHLSQSHLYCWRTLAVTLELFPSMYRKCMFQLALVPAGTLMSQQLLTELWGLAASDTPSVIQMFASVSMLVSVPTPHGPRWHVANLAQDYMVYWAKLSGKGSDIGRLQRWLLEDPARTARICNPFCETDHTLLLRSASAAAEAARLTTSATHINVDTTFAAAAAAALAGPPASEAAAAHRAACTALSLATAAFDLRMYTEALELLQRATDKFAAAGLPAESANLLRSQLQFSQAQVLHALGKPRDAMQRLENVLKEAQDSSRYASYVQQQLVAVLLEGAYASADADLALSLATVRSQMALEHHGHGVQHAAALGDLVNAQLFKCEKPAAIKQTIKVARQTLEACSRHFTLLHLNLERVVISYYLYIGRISDVETKMCKLYLQIQQVYDPHHEVAALLMNDIALCLNIQGNFSDAHDMLCEALALFRRPGATTLTQQACALAHNNLAVALAALGRPHEAQEHMRTALKGIRAMGCPFVSPQPTLYLQAALLMQLHEFDAAKEQLLQAVLHFSSARTRRVSSAAAALETLSVLFIAQGDAPNAANCLDQSLAVSSILVQDRAMRQLNDVEVAKVYFLKALLCTHLGARDQAAEYDAKFQKILASNKNHPYLLWAANLDDVTDAFHACMRRGEHAAKSDDAPPPPLKSAAVAVGTAERKTRRVLRSDPELEEMHIP